jgi:hypothetical protein
MRRLLRWTVVGTISLVALACIAVVVAIAALDMPKVKAELAQRLSQAVDGVVAWETLDLKLFPAPHGSVGKLRVEIPGRFELRAERLEASLGLIPLLHGQVQVVSFAAAKPQVRVEIPPSSEAAAQKPAPAADPITAYRAAAGDAAGILKKFAPNTNLALRDAEVEIRANGRRLLHLHGLSLDATTDEEGVAAKVETAGEYWSRLRAAARIAFADLSGTAQLELDGLKPQAWLDPLLANSPVQVGIQEAGLRVKLRTDGKTGFEGEIDAGTPLIALTQGQRQLKLPEVLIKGTARGGASEVGVALAELRLDGQKLAAGKLDYAYASGAANAEVELDLDLARTLALARQILPEADLAIVQSASGRLRAHLKGEWASQEHWAGSVQVRHSDAAVHIQPLPWPVGLQGGHAAVSPGSVKISGVRGTVGESSLSDLGAHLALGKEVRIASASGKAVLALDQLYPWVKQQEKLAGGLKQIPAISGRIEASLVRVSGRLASPDYELRLEPRQLIVQADFLPGPLGANGGAVRVTPSALKVEGLAVSLLDARTTITGTVSDFTTERLRAEIALSDGTAGAQILHWGMQLAATPPKLELRSPLSFVAKRLTWGPGKALQLDAALRFGSGVGVNADLSWSPDLLDLRRLEVDDPRGKGTLALRLKGRALQARFAGSAQGGVLDAILKEPPRMTGTVRGNMQFEMDLDQPRQWVAEGKLDAQSVDLAWLIGRPLVVERVALTADRKTVEIQEVVLKGPEQSATLRGSIRRGERGPVIEARIESAGVLVDAFLPKGEPAEPKEPSAPRKIWPLPVTGRIALDAAQVQYKHFRVTPLVATLVLEEEKASLELQKAQLCGIDAPLSLEARPDGLQLAARIDVKGQQLEELARCLTGEGVLISGKADFQADIKSRGKANELLQNMEGTVSGEASDGRVKKFALIGNILTVLSLTDVLSEMKGGKAAAEEGFPYRKLGLKGQFHAGSFLLEQGSFNSPAIGMAAKGSIRLKDWESEMTVLVAPFSRLDHVVRNVPVFGYVVGGALTSVPVGVSGDIRDPRIVPLGPRAVTDEMLGIFERTLKLPSRVIPPQQ